MSSGSYEQLLHVLDLAFTRDWGRAKTLAETIDDPIADRLFLLLGEIEEREEARTRQLAVVRHEIGNALSVAQANLEAMIDGILDATPQRLEAILNALVNASSFLEDLRRGVIRDGQAPERIETFDLAEFVSQRVKALAGLASAKRVILETTSPGQACVYRGDVVRVDAVIRGALLNVLRATEPGGRVEIGCIYGNDFVHLVLGVDGTCAQTVQHSLKHLGAEIEVAENDDGRWSFAVDLPITGAPAL